MEKPSPPPQRVRAHVFISGKVQGVSYRFYTQQKAKTLLVQGWARNLKDGRVEAVFEGTKEAVEKMVFWCNSGPPEAAVENVEVEYEQPENLRGFEIRYRWED
ncbi:MAG: acylphosphatase [Oscillatoria sp. SIO1A7]|nr:acylphosphatase [Oscillatoria sp. SIO1A7]